MADTTIAPYQFTIDAAIAEWLVQKETRTGSKKTRAAYEDTMRQFRQFLSQGGLDLLSNPIDIARVAALWANQRAGNTRRPGEDVSPATYNQRLAILSSWYTFVQEVYKLEIPNPIESVKKRPVQAYASALPIDPETVEQGLEHVDRGTLQGLRDYAILAVALSTGRRAHELVGLRWQDVRIAGRKDARVTLTFHCTGRKVMHDKLDVETSTVLLEYLHAQYGKQMLRLDPGTPVLATWDIRSEKGCGGLCWLLGTSVHTIGESRQYNRSHLPFCLHEKAHRSGNSRIGKPMVNEHTYTYLINQVENNIFSSSVEENGAGNANPPSH
jgi:integrase